MGDLSAHFDSSEFRCKGFGLRGHQASKCPRNVDPAIVWLLERIRHDIGRALPIISGNRCDWYQRHIGGVADSQHERQRAADLPHGLVTENIARRAGVTGIGLRGGWVVHVDARRPAGSWVSRWTY